MGFGISRFRVSRFGVSLTSVWDLRFQELGFGLKKEPTATHMQTFPEGRFCLVFPRETPMSCLLT